MSQLFTPKVVVTPRPASEADGARPDTTRAEAGARDATGRPQRRGLPTISCVVPCRNEADNLARLLPWLSEVLTDCSRAWEVIVVDDGSTDATALMLLAWSRLPGFRVLQLSRNFGKEAALTAGLEAAAGDVVVLLDADLQHSPALIPTFVEHWRAGFEVAYAVRQSRRDESVIKRLGTRLFYGLVNTGDRFDVPAGAGDFRLMDRKVVDALLSLPERNRFMKGLYAWVGFKAIAVPYVPEARLHGHSHFSPFRLLRLALDGLTAFTTWPLRAVTVVGFVLAALSFAYGGYLTFNYLRYGHDVNGWTTIVVSLMLFAGIQLIALGVLGEYIGRIFEEVKARPLYVVARKLGQGLETAHP
jgi:polyisoprenyl-phosphate glycosyltransferase